MFNVILINTIRCQLQCMINCPAYIYNNISVNQIALTAANSYMYLGRVNVTLNLYL